jgi:GT2 family glycosyltransferase
MSTSEVVVVSVNYFSVEHVASLLRSLDATDYDAMVVVDNSQDHGEWRALTALASRYPKVTAIRSPENGGFGAGVNQGVRAVSPSAGSAIWIVNPDVVVQPGVARRLARSLWDSGADLISPIIVTGNQRNPLVWFAGGDFDAKRGRSSHDLWMLPAAANMLSGTRDVTFLSGAALMVRASAWARLGGFREDLFLYWEDADLSVRARAAGMRLVVDGATRVWHEEGGSTADHGHSRTYFYYVQRNRIRLMREYGKPRFRLLTGAAGIETLRWCLRPLRESDQRWPKLLASVRGLLHGLRN